MTNPEHLERGYRRLLACYPKSFRREHEQEILSVLMAGASEGQRRPRPAESADLLRSAIRVRMRQGLASPDPWTRRHARVIFPVRVLSGIWLVVLTAILYGYGRGGWWAALLLPAAALHFYLAYRLRHDIVER